MQKDTILFLECKGCYFFEGDRINELSDVGNYRVGVYDNKITLADGRQFVLEFGSYDRKEMRYTHKKTGRPLKHPKYELVLENALHIDTEFEDENRLSWRDLKIERAVYEKKLTYTKANILSVVNSLSVKQFERIVMVSAEEIISRLDGIYNTGGYRERAILDDLTDIKTKQYSKEYWVFTFHDSNGNTFDYEYHSRRITG